MTSFVAEDQAKRSYIKYIRQCPGVVVELFELRSNYLSQVINSAMIIKQDSVYPANLLQIMTSIFHKQSPF